MGDRITTAGYSAAWSVIKFFPDKTAGRIFDYVGTRAGKKNGGPTQLRKNLARVLGVPAQEVPLELMQAATRSYARYWKETFRLPCMDHAAIYDLRPPGVDELHVAWEKGRGAILTLPHSGNWDIAGVWLAHRYGTFLAVAERLKPESLFEKFKTYRESLGFSIIPLTGGEEPPMVALEKYLRQGGIVCLLGDRDLTRQGVPVNFFGETTRMPSGSVRLAQKTGAPLFTVNCQFTPTGWSFPVSEQLDVTGEVPVVVQKIADLFARGIAEKPEDWHMLQPLWESDWSERLRQRIQS